MNFRQFLGVVEIRTKIVSIEGFLIGTLLAARATGRLDPFSLVVTFLSVLAIDMGTTAFNTFFDYWNGVDDERTNREADKVLVRDGVPALAALIVAASCFAAGGVLGVVLAARVGWGLVPVGAACMLAGFFYNAGPLPFSRTPAGELFAGGFLGPGLVLISFFAQARYVDARTVAASLPSYFMVAAILSANNACDVEGDRAAGRRTFAIVFGPAAGRLYLYAEVAIGYAALAALALARTIPLITCALAAPAALAGAVRLRSMAGRGFSHGAKGVVMGGILSIFAWYGAAYAGGLILGLAGIGN